MAYYYGQSSHTTTCGLLQWALEMTQAESTYFFGFSEAFRY